MSVGFADKKIRGLLKVGGKWLQGDIALKRLGYCFVNGKWLTSEEYGKLTEQREVEASRLRAMSGQHRQTILACLATIDQNKERMRTAGVDSYAPICQQAVTAFSEYVKGVSVEERRTLEYRTLSMLCKQMQLVVDDYGSTMRHTKIAGEEYLKAGMAIRRYGVVAGAEDNSRAHERKAQSYERDAAQYKRNTEKSFENVLVWIAQYRAELREMVRN